MRNEPALLSFYGYMHTVARQLEPYELLEEPIYHLDLLLQPLEARRAKADRYEALRPGMQAPGGGPMEVFYLPEEWARRKPCPTPSAHLDGVASVHAPAPAKLDPPPGRADVRLAPRAEVDELWEGRSLTDEAYRAELRCLDGDLRMAPGAAGDLTIRVRNEGDSTWPGGERVPLIWLGHRWLDVEGKLLDEATPRSPLPAAVASGGATLVRLALRAPERSGRYVIEIDLVHEDVRWFNCPLRVEVSVEDRSPSGRRRGLLRR